MQKKTIDHVPLLRLLQRMFPGTPVPEDYPPSTVNRQPSTVNRQLFYLQGRRLHGLGCVEFAAVFIGINREAVVDAARKVGARLVEFDRFFKFFAADMMETENFIQ